MSFLRDPNRKGKMVSELEGLGITPIQFKLDTSRPDLTKLDTLLGLLSAESSQFKVWLSYKVVLTQRKLHWKLQLLQTPTLIPSSSFVCNVAYQ